MTKGKGSRVLAVLFYIEVLLIIRLTVVVRIAEDGASYYGGVTEFLHQPQNRTLISSGPHHDPWYVYN